MVLDRAWRLRDGPPFPHGAPQIVRWRSVLTPEGFPHALRRGYEAPEHTRDTRARECASPMLNVILTVHLLACIAMVAVIMLQRSEGGVQGLSGGGTGGIISGRGAASVLVRTTMICAGIFFCTSLVMTRLNADEGAKPNDYEKELQKVNSGTNILGTTTPTPDAATPAVPTAVPATPDPFAALTPAPTGLPAPAATASVPAPSPGAASPRPSTSVPATRPSASAPPAAANTPAPTPSPATSPQ